MTRDDLQSSVDRIRAVELEIARRYPEGKMRTPVHLSLGQEASAVGVCSALPPDSKVYSNHRCHAHYLAMGGSLKAMIAELYGKATGCAGGPGGSMHLRWPMSGFMGTSAIVGGAIPMAVGSALAQKRSGSSGVTVVFFGDAATEQGVFWESINLATLWKLPLLFVCEDNGLATDTPIEERHNLPLKYLSITINTPLIAERQCFSLKGLPITVYDSPGREVSRVYDAVRTLSGKTMLPAMLHLSIVRQCQHVGMDGITATLEDSVRQQHQAEIDDAFAFAEDSPWPDMPQPVQRPEVVFERRV